MKLMVDRYTCINECPNQGKVWKVGFKSDDGLFLVTEAICAECGVEPMRLSRDIKDADSE